MDIRENYEIITKNITLAAKQAGRDPAGIEFIAVSKYKPIELIAQAVDLGVRSVGENRVQELTDKLEFFNEHALNVHLIGQLQTNKVKYIIGKVKTIQSLDRLQLAKEISRLGALHGVTQDTLIEVNIGGEEQKGGVPVPELYDFMGEISVLPNIRVIGLMCVPPAVGEGEARAYFARMRKLFEDAPKDLSNVRMQALSMGMSGDYMSAIAEGATMVRVGTALFGARS